MKKQGDSKKHHLKLNDQRGGPGKPFRRILRGVSRRAHIITGHPVDVSRWQEIEDPRITRR